MRTGWSFVKIIQTTYLFQNLTGKSDSVCADIFQVQHINV